MEEKIKLIQEKNKFELKINGTIIPGVRAYEITSSSDSITTLKLEIKVPKKDTIVQLTS